MNVSLQKHFLGLLVFLASPFLVWGQDVHLETQHDLATTYVFSSYPYNPSISGLPSNGSVEISDLGQDNYKLTYVPEPGFVGEDLVRLFVWVGTTWEPRYIYINVFPSEVTARPDLVMTYRNVPVDIDPLINDTGSSSVLSIKEILLVNNGQAEVSTGMDSITFTPSPDFEGVAQFNYIVCDDFGICDQGTVTVNVIGQDVSADTLRVFTKKNQAQVIFIPQEFPLTMQPQNGIFHSTGELPEYIPNPDFVGKDYMEFAGGGKTRAVEITVLDVEDNMYAFDDDIFTTSYSDVEFNVLDNDYFKESSGCLSLTQPAYGSVALNLFPNGSLTYTPVPGFQGVDKFTYTIQPPGCQGETETATVYVYVSNFEPAYSKFRMITARLTPLIIGHDIPIRNFDFEVKDQPALGETHFLSGEVDTTIYGQEVKGFNIIVYIPGENVVSGTDEFEIEYCVTQNGDCRFSKTVKIEVEIIDMGNESVAMCFDDCIWPGDTNFDGIVDMQDLMPLGAYMGEVGVPRPDAGGSLWYGQYGDDWGSPEDGNLGDLKHIDTDGDSMITALDTLAISQFYGYTHSLAPAPVPDYKHVIQLHGNVFVKPGDLIELDLILGSEGDPAIDVYGFTFPFQYNPDFFVPESAQIEYNNNSWLTYGSPVLSMTKNDNNGLLESGLTRTNRRPLTGFGSLGKARIVVSGDIEGFRPDDDEIAVEIGGGVAMVTNGRGQRFGAKIQPITIHIDLSADEQVSKSDDPDLSGRQNLNVFPNPAYDFVNIYLNGGSAFTRVVVYNMTGQEILDSGKLHSRNERLDVSRLSSGIYFMRIHTEDGVICEKFEVVR